MSGMKSSNPAKTHWKSREVKERLVALSMQLGPASRLPNTTELCRTLAISPTTLNNVLREMEAEKLIDRRRGVGIYVASDIGKLAQRQVCLLCDSSYFRGAAVSPFWNMLLDEAHRRVGSNENFRLHFVDSYLQGSPLAEELGEALRAGRVHGLIGIGIAEDAMEHIVEHYAPDLPFVCFAGPGPWEVHMDMEELISEGVRQLAMHGCQKIGLWMPATPLRAVEEIIGGFFTMVHRFRNEIEALGLEFNGRYVHCDVNIGAANDQKYPDISHQEQGYKAAHKVFGGKSRKPDGIVILDDLMTRGALVALRNKGVQPGKDVQIATHCNRGSEVLLGHEKEVIRLEFNPVDVARAMFETLSLLMQGEKPAQRVTLVTPHVVSQTQR
jgi:DNA-binding LacI/PurR family transcriptional regulator/transposase-like protein